MREKMRVCFRTVKKAAITLTVGLFGLINLSMSANPANEILDANDIELALNAPRALGSAIGEDPEWESKAEWLCLPAQEIHFQCIKYCEPEGCNEETDYDVPIATIEIGEKFYQLDHDFHDYDNCESLIAEWQTLVVDQQAVCLYAAEFPSFIHEPYDQNMSFWALFNLKVKNSVWRSDYLPYAQAESEIDGP